MKIIDLSEEHENLYCVCLEDWSSEMDDAGDHKKQWYAKMKARGLRVKLAENDDGKIGGMIQYLPIEESMAEGKDLYFINCIWVHGYKQGRGDFRKQGMGKALLQAAEEDAKALGAKGMVAWGLAIPVFMRASWFKKQGYRKADSMSMQILLWKKFTEDAVEPRWIRPKKKPERLIGKVVITGVLNGWCPSQNISFERAKRAAAEFGDTVVFRAVDTSDLQVFRAWGISDAIFIDDKLITHDPPLTYDKIKRKIARQVKRLRPVY